MTRCRRAVRGAGYLRRCVQVQSLSVRVAQQPGTGMATELVRTAALCIYLYSTVVLRAGRRKNLHEVPWVAVLVHVLGFFLLFFHSVLFLVFLSLTALFLSAPGRAPGLCAVGEQKRAQQREWVELRRCD